MSYLNYRLRALLAAGLLLLGVSSLHAQDAPATGAIRGDVDGDGRVTRADAEAVRTFLVRGTVPGGRSILPAGDANGDGRVTAADAALISRYVAGVDVSRFPVGRPIDGGTGRAPTADGRGMLLTQLECEFTVANETTTCRLPSPGANGALADIVVGSPYVTVTASKAVSNGDPNNPDTAVVTFKVTNKISQPIGTTDGTTPHPNGIRLFFNSGPTVTQVSSGALGTAKVWFDPLPDSATFTSAQGVTYTNKKYIQYNEVLQQDSSAEEPVQLVHDARVVKFAFGVLVATPVPFEHGWIDVTPLAAPIIAVDSTTTFTGTVRNQVGVTQADAKTWSSSNTAIATVDPNTGVVTGEGEGTATITVTSSVNAQRTGSRNVTVDRFPQVDSTSPADNAEGVSPGSNILVYFSEPVTVLSAAAFDLECPAGSAQAFTISGSGTSTITLNPDADLPPGITCEVSVKGNQIEDVDTNDGPNFMPGQYDFDFLVSIEAVADVFGTTTTGNVRINSASTSPVFSVTTNDKLGPTTTISFAGWGGTPGKTMGGGDVVMDTEGAGMGTFTYNPPAGFEGTDSLEYTVQQGSMTSTARVALPVSGMIWFVNNAGAACTTRANGCGRLTHPYSSLAAFQAENNGTGNNPAAGDNIFLYQSGTSYTGPVTLLGQQKLIGQDAGATLSTITGITPATGSDPLPAMDAAGAVVTINGATGGVALANIGATSGANNTVRGLTIATTGGAALSGTSFGSPVIEEVSISANGGPSLSLSGGTVNSTFATASSVGSTTQGMSLTNLSGTLTFGSGTTLSNSTGTVFLVSGGAPAITYSGGINKDGASAGRLVDISGTTAGTITFQTGTLSSTSSAGTGIQLSNAAGTVSFNGTTTLNGGDAGIDILSGSTGTFNFSANTLVQNPTGTAFNVNGSTPTVTFNGSLLRTANNALLVDLTSVASGSITFDPAAGTDSLYATIGDGIQLNNADAAVDFNGRVRLAGGNAGVDIIGGSSGNIDFDAATIANPTGEALRIFNGGAATDVSFAGAISTNAGRPVLVEGVSSGTVAVSASINTTAGLGLLVQNNSGGTMTFSNATQALNTAGNAAVSLLNNTGATVNFTGGTLDIDVTSGAGFTATGGGTVTVEGANNTVNATSGGTPVNVQNTTIGGNGMTFRTVATVNAANGIVLNNTGSGAFSVTGTGSAGSGGTIQNTSGSGIQATSASNLSFNWMNLTNAATTDGGTSAGTCANSNVSTCNAPVDLTNVTTVTLNRLAISGSEEQGIVGSNVTNFTMSNTTVQNAGDEAHEHGMIFVGLFGTNSISNSSVTGSGEANFRALNTNGTSTLTVTGSTFSSNSAALGGDGFLFDAQGTANATVNVSGSTFAANKDDHFNVTGANSAVVNVTFANNTLSGGNASAVGQGIALRAGGTYAGTFTYDIDNNTINGAIPTAINVGFGSTAAGGVLRGRIRNNDVGTTGVNLSGSAQGSCILAEANGTGTGTHTTSITNNILRRCFDKGIDLLGSRDGSNNLNATVTGNNVNELVDPSSRWGIRLETGSSLLNETGTVCADIANNTLNAATIGDEVSVRARSPVTLRFPGYTGGTTDTGALQSYLMARNPAGGSAVATVSSGATYNNTIPAGSACPTPP